MRTNLNRFNPFDNCMSDNYSLWLLPSSAQQARWQNCIDALAAEHATPRFEAHLTLASPIAISLSKARTQLALMARKHSSITLLCDQAQAGDSRFVCLTMGMRTNTALDSLRADSLSRFAIADTPYFPHVSLMYAEPELVASANVLTALPELPSQINFNRVALVNCSGEVSQWHTVETLLLER